MKHLMSTTQKIQHTTMFWLQMNTNSYVGYKFNGHNLTHMKKRDFLQNAKMFNDIFQKFVVFCVISTACGLA